MLEEKSIEIKCAVVNDTKIKRILQHVLEGKIEESALEELLNNLSEMIKEDGEIMMLCKEWLTNSVTLYQCHDILLDCKIKFTAISMLAIFIQNDDDDVTTSCFKQLYESHTINAYNEIIKRFIQLFTTTTTTIIFNDKLLQTLRNQFIYHFILFQKSILSHVITSNAEDDGICVPLQQPFPLNYSDLYDGLISCVEMYGWTKINHTYRIKLLTLCDILSHLVTNHPQHQQQITSNENVLFTAVLNVAIRLQQNNDNDEEGSLNVIELCIDTIPNYRIIMENIDEIFKLLRNLLQNVFEKAIEQSSLSLISKSLHCMILLDAYNNHIIIGEKKYRDNEEIIIIESKISMLMEDKLLPKYGKHVNQLSANFINLYRSPINGFIFTRHHIRYLFYIQMMPVFVFAGKQVDAPIFMLDENHQCVIIKFITNYRRFLIDNEEEHVAPKYIAVDSLHNQDEKIYGLELLMLALDGVNRCPGTRHHESICITLLCCALRLLETIREIPKTILLPSVPCINYLLKQTCYQHSMVYTKGIEILGKLMAKYHHNHTLSLTNEEKDNLLHTILDIITDRMHDIRWPVRDTALNLFNHLLFRIHDMFHSHIESKIIEIIKCMITSEKDDFVRAQAIDSIRLLHANCYSCDQCRSVLQNTKGESDVSSVTETVIYKFHEETEGIVRRSIVRYLTTVYENNLLPYSDGELVTFCVEKLMLQASNDFYWEVRLDALIFWQKYMEQTIIRSQLSNNQDVIDVFVKLGESGCLEAIINTSIEDEYDTKVFEYSSSLTKRLKCIISQYNVTLLDFERVITTGTTFHKTSASTQIILNKFICKTIDNDPIKLNEEKMKLTNRLRRDALNTMICKLLKEPGSVSVTDTPDCY